ncbi:MAG: hypothetical protein V7691_13395 [Galbibacter orientalis]|uniref:hypothetical protein n=1 Tax=Galbibacter orientalis TaxID=453852 RepID=UPI00300396B0
MKLNKEQIQEIEYALNKRGLDYIDLKYELLDHIATDIEQLMTEDKTISFEEASNQAFDKWKDALKEYSSFWLGVANFGPKILIKRTVSILKKAQLKLLAYGVFIAGLLFFLIKIGFIGFTDSFMSVYGIFQYFIGAIFLVLFLTIRFSGYKTCYSFIYNVQIAPFLFYYILFNYNLNFFVRPFEGGFADLINVFVQVEMLLYPLFAYRVFKNHFKLRERKVSVS